MLLVVGAAACGAPGDAACEAAPDAWSLWRAGCLRGANVYQADLTRDDAGDEFGPTFAPSDLTSLAAVGANLVALSVPGPRHVRDGGPWPEALDHLREMVAAAGEADLFVSIAVRTGPGRSEGDIIGIGPDIDRVWNAPEDQDAWVSMGRELAEAVAPYGHVVGLDLMVEPHDVEPARWRALASEVLDGVRDVAGDLPVLVEPPDWSSVSALDGWVPPDDPYVVTSVHQYEPFDYTHGDRDGFDDSELDVFYEALDAYRSQGRMVAVTEFGVTSSKPFAAAFLEASLARLDALGVSHAAWLWEVADPSGYRRFDFKQDPDQLAAFERSWARNVVRPSTW